MKHRRRAALGISAAVVAAAALSAGAVAAPSKHSAAVSPAVAKQLTQVKAALSKYRSVAVAKADGYVEQGACVMAPTSKGASWFGGAMGIHFVNEALLKPGPFVPTKPPILVYLPTKSGHLQLVAAEYFKPDADQNLKTDGDRPTLFGRAFDGPMLGHAPGMPIHYDLHVWLWKHNPSGLFAGFNPSASCTG
jgi:hypothetical protein